MIIESPSLPERSDYFLVPHHSHRRLNRCDVNRRSEPLAGVASDAFDVPYEFEAARRCPRPVAGEFYSEIV